MSKVLSKEVIENWSVRLEGIDLKDDLIDSHEELRRQLDIATKALEFYADQDQFRSRYMIPNQITEIVKGDGGQTAKQALKDMGVDSKPLFTIYPEQYKALAEKTLNFMNSQLDEDLSDERKMATILAAVECIKISITGVLEDMGLFPKSLVESENKQ